jgi:hypothetical protein
VAVRLVVAVLEEGVERFGVEATSPEIAYGGLVHRVVIARLAVLLDYLCIRTNEEREQSSSLALEFAPLRIADRHDHASRQPMLDHKHSNDTIALLESGIWYLVLW